MKVKELIAVLEGMPDDATVVFYDGLDEGDGLVKFVKLITKKGSEEYFPPYYCAGDSAIYDAKAGERFVVLSDDEEIFEKGYEEN